MNRFDSIVRLLKENLNKGLPGLLAQQKMAPDLRGRHDLPKKPNVTTRESAVLISVYPENGLANTILIKRPVYNGAHSGQVSFPGGKREIPDKSLIETALREAEEEVGIDTNLVEILGSLTPLFVPVSNLIVVPIIGIMPKPIKLHPNIQEVEYVITANLDDFKLAKNISTKTICIGKIPISAPYYNIMEEVVWGITAMIIAEFSELY